MYFNVRWARRLLQQGIQWSKQRSPGNLYAPVEQIKRTLTEAQERHVFRWVNGKDPRQYGFDFGLWTRHLVRELIAQRFGVTLSLASVGALLARVRRTPQKPLERADQRDPEAIARQARRDGADLYFRDESGFRADAVHGTTWGAKGPNYSKSFSFL